MPVDLGVLGTLLAKNLDEIPDPPKFKTPPIGRYSWIIEKIESKTIGEKEKATPIIALTYMITNIIEQTETDIDEEEQVKIGDKFGESFWFGDPQRTDETISWMKDRFAGLADACGTRDLLEIVTKSEGMEVTGLVKHRYDKKDSTKIYPQISAVVPAY